jgi:S-adenosylmethionine:tRNA ribosyltransferase-isomerase
LAFQQKKKSSWYCLVGNAKKWKEGPLFLEGKEGLFLKVHKGPAHKDGYIIDFQWEDDAMTFADVLDMAGKTPLPPYIGRKAEENDKERYQTIFAQHSGSVAAPTAGLHFTDRVMQSLAQKEIEPAYLTLHVGAGTFKPVSSSTMEGHEMHFEQIAFSMGTLQQLMQYSYKNVICVGTTSMRSLESLYWLGMKIASGYKIPQTGFSITQWEPYAYSENQHLPVDQAIALVIEYMNKACLESIHGETSLIIVPGYKVKIANYLITNFHQPKSTLLLLVAAFCGSGWRNIYEFALNNDFRFLSYGDSCLLKKRNYSGI